LVCIRVIVKVGCIVSVTLVLLRKEEVNLIIVVIKVVFHYLFAATVNLKVA